ncbi:DUF1127 domain-containing protein [Reyranella sp.]|uniref:DUF1127 domain-containing protein n=1 Tax=Reyranella sp. TaxID=1929291 RepID=UPI003BA949D1
MSTLSSVRGIARPATSSFTLGRATSLLAGVVVVGIEKLMTRAELARSRRQLGQLDERLLRDIGIDRATARNEAGKGYWL